MFYVRLYLCSIVSSDLTRVRTTEPQAKGMETSRRPFRSLPETISRKFEKRTKKVKALNEQRNCWSCFLDSNRQREMFLSFFSFFIFRFVPVDATRTHSMFFYNHEFVSWEMTRYIQINLHPFTIIRGKIQITANHTRIRKIQINSKSADRQNATTKQKKNKKKRACITRLASLNSRWKTKIILFHRQRETINVLFSLFFPFYNFCLLPKRKRKFT